MVGTVPSGSCLQGVRVERPIAAHETNGNPLALVRSLAGEWRCEFLEAWGNLSKGGNRHWGKPRPAPAHSLSMSFQLAIPGPVALQQSLPPLRQPPPILPQSGKAVESGSRTSRRPPHTGLDAEKTSRCPTREKCFLLDIPSYRTRQGALPSYREHKLLSRNAAQVQYRASS